MVKKEEKVSLISIEDLFRESFKVYKKIWVPLFVISFFTVAAWKIWQLIVVPILLVTLGVSSVAAGFATGNISQTIGVALIGLSVFLLSWIVIFEINFFGSAATIVTLNQHLKGKRPAFGDIFNETKKLLGAVTVVSFLVIFAQVVGFILFVIPGIIMAILLSFSNFIVVTEKERDFTVLHRSIHLVKKYFWAILGRYLAIGIVAFLINIIFNRVILFQFAAQTLILPFTITYHFLLFKDVLKKS